MTCGARASLIRARPASFVFPPPSQTVTLFNRQTFLAGITTSAVASELRSVAPANVVLTLPTAAQITIVSVAVIIRTVTETTTNVVTQAATTVAKTTTVTLTNLATFAGAFTQQTTETLKFGMDITQITSVLNTFTASYFASIKATSFAFESKYTLIFTMNSAGTVGMDCKIDYTETVAGATAPQPLGSPAFAPFDISGFLTLFTTGSLSQQIVAATPAGFSATVTTAVSAIGVALVAVEKLVVPAPLPVLQKVSNVVVGGLATFNVPFVATSTGGLIYGVDVSGFIAAVSSFERLTKAVLMLISFLNVHNKV